MKTKAFTQKIQATLLMALILLMSAVSVKADTFTAVTSGNWSSAATWGGTAPSFNVTSDQIIIPALITVTLDGSVTLNGSTAAITSTGTLTSGSNMTSLTITMGSLAGLGTVNVDNLTLGTGASLLFAGSLTANTITNWASGLSLAAATTANQTLTLAGGSLTFSTNGSLGLGSNATVVVSGGTISAGAGIVSLNTSYNVTYNSVSATGGLELTGSGLTNVTVNVGTGNNVTLLSPLTINGTLGLTSGTLVLNGNDLTLTTTGNVAASGNGSISSGTGSSITINSVDGISGTLNFSTGSMVNNFTVNMNIGSGNQVQIGGDLTVNGTLALTGGTLNIGTGSLAINGNVTGSGSLSGNSYSNLSVNTSGGISAALNFAPSGQTINNLTINIGSGNAVTLGSGLTVGGTLTLNGGSNLDISGQSLTIGGSVTGTGSLLVNPGSSLTLNGSGSAGLSLSGSIGNVTVNVGSGNVTLSSDLTIAGTLTLTSGTLALNGYNLTIAATGNVAASGGGTILPSINSNIIINATAGLTGSLSFSGSSNVGGFTVNVGTGNQVLINGNLTVNGVLNLTGGTLNLGTSTLKINGGLNGSGLFYGTGYANLNINTTGGVLVPLTFAIGGQTIGGLTVNVGSGNTAILGSNLIVSGGLQLTGGSQFDISGQALTVGAGISGSGTLVVDSASSLGIDGSSQSAVGLNLSGNIGTLRINVGDNNSLLLTGDLTITNMLYTQSGSLTLNGHNLTLTGNITIGGTGTISSTAASNITVNTGASVAGALEFAAGADTVNILTVNVEGGGVLNLGSNTVVTGSLVFTLGSVNIDSDTLYIASGATITGADSNSYVITNVNGRLAINVTAGSGSATIFPIGTSAHFAPATVSLAAGSASGTIMAGIMGNVLTEGTTGISISAYQPVVNATWFVESNITSNLNLALGVTWSAAMQVNGFNDSLDYIAHFTGGAWDSTAAVAATANANGTFSLTRSGLTSLSPFAVFNTSTNEGIGQVASESLFELAPNPVTDHINVRTLATTSGLIYADVIDINGQVLSSYRITDSNTSIPTSQLSQGNYFIRLYNDQVNVVKQFSKF